MSKDIPSWKRERDPKRLAAITKYTEEGDYNLTDSELWWRDRYELLLDHGYQLRPRFRPGWKPSWLGTDLIPEYCEDSMKHRTTPIMDATRISNGTVVVIKKTREGSAEGRVAQHFSTNERVKHPANHCVPLVDRFVDERLPKIEFVVMPLLRRYDSPPFFAVGEIVDFVQQTLEGLEFMHEEGIAHRDCSSGNIMLDGSPLYPSGFHPSNQRRDKTGALPAMYNDRIASSPVKYYFIDFGLSVFLRDDGQNYVLGQDGQDQEVPELSRTVEYQASPVDVFILGNVYRRDLLSKYSNLEFLRPLVDAMTQKDPKSRPTSSEAYAQFKALALPKWGPSLRWRLRSREEKGLSRLYGDVSAVAREGKYIVTSIAFAPVKAGRRLFSALPFRKPSTTAS